MGIIAAVVYDIQSNSTVVLRTPTSSRKRRHEVLDTIASFSQHCEFVQGVAQSVTHVCALWGGPPYITYNIAASRFRVIIIWDKGLSDINIAYDVHHVLARLQRVVNSSAEALIQHESSAIIHVYEEAGHALRNDEPFILPVPSSNTSRSKLFSSITTRRPTAPSSDLNNTPTNKKTTLFGKLGAALKTSASDLKSSKKQHNVSKSSNSSTQVFGPSGALDDAEGPLALPADVFEWCYFGTPLPDDDPGNLDWFAHLFQPDSFVAPVPSSGPSKSSFPALRAGSASSTPLTFPSSAPLPPVQNSGTSSITPPAPMTEIEPQARDDQHQQDPKIPESNANVLEKAMSPTPNSLSSLPLPPPSNQEPIHPIRSPQSVVSPQSSDSTSQPPAGSGSQPTVQSTPSKSVKQSPIVSFNTAQQYQQQLQEDLQNKRQQLLQEQQRILQQQNLGVHAHNQHNQQNSQSQQLQMQQQILQNQQHQSQFSQKLPTIQSTHGQSTQNTPKESDDGIPESLKQKDDDFDVSQLGVYKDSASASVQKFASSATDTPSGTDQAENEAIRTRMNEFAISMQNGNFTTALRQVYDTLRFLCRIEPRREREIITCSNYVLAQKILIRNAAFENELSSPQIISGTPAAIQRLGECALLTMFLAELKHLLPRHRVAAMRVAIEKNFQVGNFGMCVRWLKQLIEKAPPNQKQALTIQLQTCVANGEQNAHMPPTNRLCYTTLQVVTSPFGGCDTCTAVYHASLSGTVEGQACDTCFVGTIHSKQ